MFGKGARNRDVDRLGPPFGKNDTQAKLKVKVKIYHSLQNNEIREKGKYIKKKKKKRSY